MSWLPDISPGVDHTPLYDAMIFANAALSAIIVTQLMFFRRNGSRHKAWAGWVAWLLIGVEISFPVRVLMGCPVVMDVGHLALNVLLCSSLVAVEGNVAELFKRTQRLVNTSGYYRRHNDIK